MPLLWHLYIHFTLYTKKKTCLFFMNYVRIEQIKLWATHLCINQRDMSHNRSVFFLDPSERIKNKNHRSTCLLNKKYIKVKSHQILYRTFRLFSLVIVYKRATSLFEPYTLCSFHKSLSSALNQFQIDLFIFFSRQMICTFHLYQY